MNHDLNKKNKSGFTLIEMLISLSIFGVVTAFAMANFRAGSQGDELRLSARTTSSFIQRARTQAISGYSVYYCRGGNLEGKICPTMSDSECAGGACIRDIPPAYGINISTDEAENRQLRIFADTNNNGVYDQGEAIRFDPVSAGPSVYVSSVYPSSSGKLDIVFKPPKPNILFNNSQSEGSASVTLKHMQTEKEIVVTINRISGLISID